MRQLTRKEWAASFIGRALRPSENEIPLKSLTDILVIGPTYLREILDEQGIEYTEITIFAEWTVEL